MGADHLSTLNPANLVPPIVQTAELHRSGWRFVDVLLPSTARWPGYASIVLSPEGDVAIMGDGNDRPADPYDADDADADIAWARRVIGTPTAIWTTP